jgi:hypothetical protein
MATVTDPAVDVVVVDVKAVARGYRVSQLIDSEVFNDGDEKIGRLDDFIIGRDDRAGSRDGRILFAIMQVGGFLGIGGRLVAVPFASLALEDAGGTMRVMLSGATRESLEKLPEFIYGG